jgi:WD40 repeat protein
MNRMSNDGTYRLWDIETRSCVLTLTGGSDFCRDFAISPTDGLYVAIPKEEKYLAIYRLSVSRRERVRESGVPILLTRFSL